jgi:hypothetical protein
MERLIGTWKYDPNDNSVVKYYLTMICCWCLCLCCRKIEIKFEKHGDVWTKIDGRAIAFELNKPFTRRTGGEHATNILTTFSWIDNELVQVDQYGFGNEVRWRYRVNDKNQLEVIVEGASCQCGNDINIYRKADSNHY